MDARDRSTKVRIPISNHSGLGVLASGVALGLLLVARLAALSDLDAASSAAAMVASAALPQQRPSPAGEPPTRVRGEFFVIQAAGHHHALGRMWTFSATFAFAWRSPCNIPRLLVLASTTMAMLRSKKGLLAGGTPSPTPNNKNKTRSSPTCAPSAKRVGEVRHVRVPHLRLKAGKIVKAGCGRSMRLRVRLLPLDVDGVLVQP